MSHWYATDGSPNYTVKSANGQDRPTTLRDARKHGWLPSVTGILGVIDKPALNDWKCKQAVIAAMCHQQNEWESAEDYISRMLSAARQVAMDMADEGGRIHDAIESWFKDEEFESKYIPHVNAVDRELNRLFPGIEDWVSEKSFGHQLGFAGRVDLFSPSTGIVVDFKTKDGDFTDGKKLAYDQSHQLAAYRIGLDLPAGNVGCNIFVSRDVPGAVASHIWTREEMADSEDVFLLCLSLWKALKKYDPSFGDKREANHSK